MTALVETDFLIALVKDDDWLQERAEEVLEERDVVTSAYAYLEVMIIREHHEFDYVSLVSNLLEVVPVGSDEETQLVLKATNYYEEGMTPFDAFHAATAESRGLSIVSSDEAYDEADAERIALEPENVE